MSALLAQVQAPEIDYKELSPLFALAGGSVIVLLVGLLGSRVVRAVIVPVLTAVALLTAIGLTIWIWEPGNRDPILEGALGVDTLALGLSMLFYVAGLVTVVLSLRSLAPEQAGHGEYHSLLLGSIAGMVVLAGSESLMTLFIGFELLSIPLYVLCATHLHRRTSLEAGLKYLVVGSVGSATLLYGLALVYGATGELKFDAISGALGRRGEPVRPAAAHRRRALRDRSRVQGVRRAVPPVDAGRLRGRPNADHHVHGGRHQGRGVRNLHPAVRSRARVGGARLGARARRARCGDHRDWQRGAIPQRSVKRMLAWSSVAQAGYLLAGVVVHTELGVRATAFYLAVYLLMNVAAFAVVVARERVSEHGDDLRSFENLGTISPWLAWPMTIAMLSLAGFPATGGFIGKFYLIDASVAGDYTWLGITIVIGSVISLAYYLRLIAVMWMGRYEVELQPCRRAGSARSRAGPPRPTPEPSPRSSLSPCCSPPRRRRRPLSGPAVRPRPRREQRPAESALAPAAIQTLKGSDPLRVKGVRPLEGCAT